MRTPYLHAMLFLTYIKGDRVEDWTSMMTQDINHQACQGVSINNEVLWDCILNLSDDSTQTCKNEKEQKTYSIKESACREGDWMTTSPTMSD